MTRFRVALLALLALVGGALATPVAALATADPPPDIGTVDRANFIIQMPDPWNGTLVLYSHGYRTPGTPMTPQDAGDPATGAWLVANHYAIAGSSYSANGWALQHAFHDQIALLDHFQAEHGKPLRTIAWGHSLGGIITGGLIQLNPERFDGALPMCGVLAGGPGVWNQGLDAEFVFKTLSSNPAAAGLLLVNITDPGANLTLAETVVAGEHTARIAATPSAVDYLEKYIVFNGDIEQPVLTMHTTGVRLVLNQDAQAYASVVRSAGNASLLREVFVHCASHCSGGAGTGYNTLGGGTAVSPSFIEFTPTVLRTFDARNL